MGEGLHRLLCVNINRSSLTRERKSKKKKWLQLQYVRVGSSLSFCFCRYLLKSEVDCLKCSASLFFVYWGKVKRV